jgi:hypothetical protein
MIPSLRFGLTIHRDPSLRDEPPVEAVERELNYLHPVLGNDYVATIKNDDEHTYKADNQAYTIRLKIPDSDGEAEINRLEPIKGRIKVGYAVLLEAFSKFHVEPFKEDDLEGHNPPFQYSTLGNMHPFYPQYAHLLKRLETFFGDKYIFSIKPADNNYDTKLEMKPSGGDTIKVYECYVRDEAQNVFASPAIDAVYKHLKASKDK